jgi:hypothetical protein
MYRSISAFSYTVPEVFDTTGTVGGEPETIAARKHSSALSLAEQHCTEGEERLTGAEEHAELSEVFEGKRWMSYRFGYNRESP